MLAVSAARMHVTTESLLEQQLRERFGSVRYRPELDRYEIGGIVLLSSSEASAVGAGALTLEQIVLKRSMPAHLWNAYQSSRPA